MAALVLRVHGNQLDENGLPMKLELRGHLDVAATPIAAATVDAELSVAVPPAAHADVTILEDQPPRVLITAPSGDAADDEDATRAEAVESWNRAMRLLQWIG